MNAAGIQNAKNAVKTVTNSIIPTKSSGNNIKEIIGIIIIICVIVGFLVFVGWLFTTTKDNYNSIPSYENNKKILNTQLGGKTEKMIDSVLNRKKGIISSLKIVNNDEPIDDMSSNKIIVRNNHLSLVNFCVLGCQLAGYAGPRMNGVFFDDEMADPKKSEYLPDPMEMSIKAGARLFIFDIDHDENLKPYLACKDKNGNRLSNNKGSLERCIATLARSIQFGETNNDPIIIVLSFRYIIAMNNRIYRLMSNVARALNPIKPYLLRQTPSGVYDKQRMADQLFLRPITEYENKVIILSNADTSIYNDVDMKKYNIKIGESITEFSNLDLLINARIYTSYDNTELPQYSKSEKGAIVSARVNGIDYYKNIPDADTKTITDFTQKEFTISMDYLFSDDSPNKELLSLLHAKYGVNCVPVNLFSTPKEESKQSDPDNPDVILPAVLTNKWFNTYSYILKPAALRYTIPDGIEIRKPLDAANTKGGNITTPNI